MSENIEQEFAKQRRSKVAGYYRAGFTVGSIAKILACPEDLVRSDLSLIVRQLARNIQYTQQEMIALQYERLSFLEEKLTTQVNKGDIKAVRTALDINTAKGKLLGLFKAETIQSDEFPVDLSALTPEEIAEGEAIINGDQIKALSDEELRKHYFESLQKIGKR